MYVEVIERSFMLRVHFKERSMSYLWWWSYISPLSTIFQFGIFSSLLSRRPSVPMLISRINWKYLFEGVFEHLYPPDQIVLEVFLTFSLT